MALKSVYETVDAVPEALREHYAEKDGKFHLAADGMVAKERLDEFRERNITTSKELDAAFVADDAINGLQNVTERAPVPMPIAISEEPLPMEQEAPASESAAPTPEPDPKDAAATPKREEAAAPANPDHKTFTGTIIGVNPLEGKKPAKVLTEDANKNPGPKFVTWDKAMIQTATDFGAGSEPVVITYDEQTKDRFTNLVIVKIERIS